MTNRRIVDPFGATVLLHSERRATDPAPKPRLVLAYYTAVRVAILARQDGRHSLVTLALRRADRLAADIRCHSA